MNPSAIKGQITKFNKVLDALEPGETLVKPNMHIEVYHGCKGVSTSKIKTFLSCPAKYHALYVTGEVQREVKTAFDLGKAAHSLILEPEKFQRDNVIQPAEIKVRRGKAWDEFSKAHPSQTIITGQQWDDVQRMRDAVMRHPVAAKFISNGKVEESYFKRDEETGLIIKCRADIRYGDALLDLKTAASSDPEEFSKTALRVGYHIQDALYLNVTNYNEFVFIAVEKEAPHIVTAPIIFSESAKRYGYLQYRNAMNKIAQCELFDLWPGYTDPKTAVVMDLKPWDEKKLEQLEEAINE